MNLAMLGIFLVVIQNLWLVLGYSPLRSAMALLPVAVLVLPVSAATPLLARVAGLRVVMTAGTLLLAVSLVWLAMIDIGNGYRPLLLAMVPFSVGFARATTPATTSIVGSLPLSRQGLASAVNDVTREVGAAVGIALLGSIYTSTLADRMRSEGLVHGVHIASSHAVAAAAVIAASCVVVAALARPSIPAELATEDAAVQEGARP